MGKMREKRKNEGQNEVEKMRNMISANKEDKGEAEREENEAQNKGG